MLSRTRCSILALTGMIATGPWVWAPAASEELSSLVEGRAAYAPIQSISYDFGSKFTSGYFERRGDSCVLTLMITERMSVVGPPAQSPTRIRIVLNPKQIAGLDSEEGRSLNFTCGEGAETLIVDAGEREKLVGVQERALQETIANKP